MNEKNDAVAPRGRGKKLAAAIVAVVVGLIGLAMLLYPTIADYANAYNNKRIINQYKKQVQQIQQLGENKYAELIEEVIAYNAALAKRSMYIGDLNDAQREIYMNTLDIMGTGVIGYIEVEKVNISLAIYHGTDEGVLHVGVGHLEGSSFPFIGEDVHSVLSAHSGLPSAKLFTNIDQLVIGDTFTIHVLNERLTYQVDDIQVILPDEVDKLLIKKGENLCTLMTCTPYGVNSHRLIVTGHLIETPEDNESDPIQSAAPNDVGQQEEQDDGPFRISLPVIIPAVIIAGALLTILLVWYLKRRS